jgi:hypothetical protein
MKLGGVVTEVMMYPPESPNSAWAVLVDILNGTTEATLYGEHLGTCWWVDEG